MIKRLFICILMAVICLSIANAPNFVVSKMEKVKYVKPITQTINEAIYCTGTITSENICEIYTDTPVYPQFIFSKVGDKVKSGDIIAQIDTKTTLNTLTNSSALETNINRIYELVSKLPNPEILYVVGKAYGISEKQIDEFFTSAKYTKTEPKISFVQPTITSPINGIITQMNIEQSVMSKSDKPAVVICDDEKLIAKLNLKQSDAEKIQVGMYAEIFDSNEKISGEIISISPAAYEAKTGETMVSAIVLLEKSGNLKCGYSVEANINLVNALPVLTLPIDAIKQDDVGEYVYKIENNRASKKYVEVGNENAVCSEILTGISADDMIIAGNNEYDENQRILIEGEFAVEN